MGSNPIRGNYFIFFPSFLFWPWKWITNNLLTSSFVIVARWILGVPLPIPFDLCALYYSKCTVAWRQLWNFTMFQVKFNRFLYPHMNMLEDILIACKMVWLDSLENWHFLTFKVNIQHQNANKSFRKWFSFLNMWIVEQLLSMTFYHFLWFWNKMCPIFDSSASTIS